MSAWAFTENSRSLRDPCGSSSRLQSRCRRSSRCEWTKGMNPNQCLTNFTTTMLPWGIDYIIILSPGCRALRGGTSPSLLPYGIVVTILIYIFPFISTGCYISSLTYSNNLGIIYTRCPHSFTNHWKYRNKFSV